MRLSELLKTTDVSNVSDCEIRGITHQAAAVKRGWAYVCRVGATVDGHDFAAQAAANGAAVIIAQRDVGLANTILVPDTGALWPRLCAAWFGYPARRLRVVGVTGTNGKTSTCHLLWSLLTACGARVGLVGTVENRIAHLTDPADHTTPDAYDLQRLFALMVADGCEYAVMEVSSHALCQGRTAGLPFAVGVFTNLTEDHLDYHHTMDAYAAAKRRLFEQSAIAVVNADDVFGDTVLGGFRGETVRFTRQSAGADLAAIDPQPTPTGTAFTLRYRETSWRITLPLMGDFAVSNALAAFGAAVSLGFDPQDVARALEHVPPVRGRAETVGYFRGARVVIDYAHTPDGLMQIGRSFRPYTSGTLTILFGCGGDRDRAKRPLMAQAAASVADRLVITTDNPRTEDPVQIINEIVAGLSGSDTPYTVIVDRARAIEHLLATARAGDTLVLAGKGHETKQQQNGRTVAFDERAIVQRIIESEDIQYDTMATHHHGDCGI